MRLRVRGENVSHIVGENLTGQSSIGDLKAQIHQALGIPSHNQRLKSGFPPKIISVNDSTTLSDANIRDSEQILVEFMESVSVSEPTPTIATIKSSESKYHSSNTSNLSNEDRKNNSHQISVNSVLSDSKVVENAVRTEDGTFLVIREMDDDNSCLFHAISYVLGGSHGIKRLREIVANEVKADPENFSEIVLGRNPAEYSSWITKPASWGGAIELSIFSKYFKIEIDSIDVATLRVDRFGEGQYDKRVLLIYSGIHYDAAALSYALDAPKEFDQTNFNVDDEHVVENGVKLALLLQKQRKFTDLSNFTLRCGVCKIGLKGQKEAQQHALETKHTSFAEY